MAAKKHQKAVTSKKAQKQGGEKKAKRDYWSEPEPSTRLRRVAVHQDWHCNLVHSFWSYFSFLPLSKAWIPQSMSMKKTGFWAICVVDVCMVLAFYMEATR